ncbi:MAG: N-acetylmuramoyl-L-alanine amidase family protein [Candidatus Dormibacteria bacterium]
MRKGPIRPLHVPALALGIAFLAGGLVTGTVLASPRTPVVPKLRLKPPAPYVVAVMPGHGGIDPGAISPFNGLKEKNVTLSMGLDLRRDLEALGVRVVMTRTTDTDVTIAQAERIAARGHARVLLSLWVNDWTDQSLEGATVFMPHKKDSRLASALNKDLATAIAPAGMGDRGTQMLPQLWVHTPMPAVTIEVGFMSNPQDSQLLAEPSFRSQIASGLAQGVVAYAPQIPRIGARLLRYQRAEARVLAAQRAAQARQARAAGMDPWAKPLALIDLVLVLAVFWRLSWGLVRRRAPRMTGRLARAGAGLGRAVGSGLDLLWEGISGNGPPRSEPEGLRRRPSGERRRPPREWGGRSGSLHPRRVTEMVQPQERFRRSVYDDFSL